MEVYDKACLGIFAQHLERLAGKSRPRQVYVILGAGRSDDGGRR